MISRGDLGTGGFNLYFRYLLKGRRMQRDWTFYLFLYFWIVSLGSPSCLVKMIICTIKWLSPVSREYHFPGYESSLTNKHTDTAFIVEDFNVFNIFQMTASLISLTCGRWCGPAWSRTECILTRRKSLIWLMHFLMMQLRFVWSY